MNLNDVVRVIADLLKDFDASKPVHKHFKPGIGPFGEPQLVKEISKLLERKGHQARTRRVPDLVIDNEWALEFKIIRPFGDNGREAENWSVNLLHPYAGNTSAIGDAIKLIKEVYMSKKAIFVIGYEHESAKISLNPLLDSFEVIAKSIMKLSLGQRIEEKRNNLVHPEHQVIRCIAWEILNNKQK